MSRASLIAVLLLASSSLLACKPQPTPKTYAQITPKTTAPPGATTEYVQDLPRGEYREIRLTEGVAMALECRDSKGTPCLLEGSTVSDEGVAGFRRAYGDIDQAVAYGRRSSTQVAYVNRSLFVLVGKKPGHTTLMLHTGEAVVTVAVEVFPATR